MPTFLISWFDTAEFLCEQNVYKIVCGCMCLQGVKKIFIEKKNHHLQFQATSVKEMCGLFQKVVNK